MNCCGRRIVAHCLFVYMLWDIDHPGVVGELDQRLPS